MTVNFTLHLPTILILLVAVLAIIDGVYRARGRGGILPILTIIVAVLLGLSAFISLVVVGTQVLEIVLMVLLVLVLVFRGSTKRGAVLITVVAIVVDAVLILSNPALFTIPPLF